MRRHPWPGNVRELRFTLQRALQLCDDGVIMPADLMLGDEPAKTPMAPAPQRQTAQAARLAAERVAIKDALERHGGDVTQALKTLNFSQATFYRKLKQHSLHR